MNYNVTIYQLSDNNEKKFKGYDGNPVKMNDYKKVFNYKHKSNVKNVEAILNEIYNHFQLPVEGFKGHSLSVSDLVVMNGTPYYVDRFGFVKIDNVM